MKTVPFLLVALMTAVTVAAQTPPAGKKTPPPTPVDWRSPLEDHPGEVGQDLLFACPPGGTPAPGIVWGTDVYTTDSAICAAAVHAGRITVEEGGTVTVRVVPGRDFYAGSPGHGIDSLDHDDTWEKSFVFVDRPGAPYEESTPVLSWKATAQHLLGREVGKATLRCPPGGTPAKVWGTDVYTADSSICSAAVHAGKITADDGGLVTVTIRPGRESYQGSERHGVVSESYGSWDGSFTFE